MMAGCVLLCSTFKGRMMHCKHEGAANGSLGSHSIATSKRCALHKLLPCAALAVMMAGCGLLCSTCKGRRMYCKHEGATHWTLRCNGTAPTSCFHKLVQHVISDFACLEKGDDVKEVALVMWLACGTMSWHPCTLHSLCVNAHKDVVSLSPCCRPCRPSCPCRPVDPVDL